MKHINLPGTDLTTSSLCLGTADMGTRIPTDKSHAILNAFVDAGGNFLDTARVYAEWVPGGRHISEKTLGVWLEATGQRDRIVIATKGGHPRLDAMHISRLSPEEIAEDVSGSLADLRTDRIDLYYLHRDDPTCPVEGIMEALWQQVDAGKVRYLGCSNWTLPRIEAAQAFAAQSGRTGFVANQMLWNAGLPGAKLTTGPAPITIMDDALKAWHQKTQMAAIPFSSQANGLFQKLDTGGLEALKPGTRATYSDPANLRRLEKIQRLRNETRLSITQITLGYLQAHPFPVSPIVGPQNQEQLADTLTAADISLTPQQVAFIDDAPAP